MALDAEGFRVVSWDPDYTPGSVCPRMTGVRPAFIKNHPEIGVKLLQVDAMASEAVAKDPQVDPASAHSLASKEGGLAGKLQLAMQVLHATKSIPEPVPMSAIQNAIDSSHLKEFAALGRAK